MRKFIKSIIALVMSVFVYLRSRNTLRTKTLANTDAYAANEANTATISTMQDIETGEAAGPKSQSDLLRRIEDHTA